MGRKVSVALEADVAGFVAPVETAKKAVDDLGDKVGKLDKELDKIPPDAAKAAAAVRLLGGDINSVGDKVATLGEKNTGLTILDTKIKETRGEVKKLADEFVKTGDVDVFKKLGDAQGRLISLQNVRKKLAEAIVPKDEDYGTFFQQIGERVSKLGDSIAKTLPDAVSGALSTPVLGPIIAAGLLAAVISAITFVMSSVGGLITAAGVGGAVGLGVMGAILGNPDVIKARWKTAVDGIKHEFIDAAQPMQQPLVDAASQVRAAFGSMHLDQTFAKAATYLQPLLTAGLSFARSIGEAVNALAEGGGPVVQALSEELPKIGRAIAIASESIADGSEGGAQALKDLFGAVEVVITGLGGMIGAAEKAYGTMAKFRDAVIPRDWIFPPDAPAHLEAAGRALHGVGEAAKSSVVDLNEMDKKLGQTEVSVDSLAGKIVDKLFSATMAADQATLGMAEAHTRLQETFEASRKTLGRHADQLNINTKEGQANREAILASVQANVQAYQSNLALGMSAEDAAKAYDDGTASIEAQLHKLGLTQGQIDGVIGKYRDIPHKVDTDIAIHGLTDAINNLDHTLRLINGLKDKTVYVTVKQVGDNPRGQSRGGSWAKGGIRRAAQGMIVPPSDPGTTLFGEPETGGEAFIPLKGISQGRAMELAQVVGDSYGFGVSTSRSGGGPLSVQFVFAGGTADPVAGMFQRLVDDGRVQLYVGSQRVQARRG